MRPATVPKRRWISTAPTSMRRRCMRLDADDHDLGKLELTARPSGNDWQIESLKLKNDAGTISAEGWWRAGEPQQTKFDVALEVSEANAFLARFGMADAVRGAPTTIKG